MNEMEKTSSKPSKNNNSVLLILALVLCGLLFLVYKKTDFVKNMTSDTTYGVGESLERDFLLQMIPHHVEAIESSLFISGKTKDRDVKKLADDIVTAQNVEVDLMKTWLKTWYNQDYVGDDGAYMKMMSELTSLPERVAEKTYLDDMVMHHTIALIMAEQVLLVENIKPEVRDLALDILLSQEAEITFMKDLMETNYKDVEAQSTIDHSTMNH